MSILKGTTSPKTKTNTQKMTKVEAKMAYFKAHSVF